MPLSITTLSRIYFYVMLSVGMMSIIMLSVGMTSIIMLSVIMLNVIVLCRYAECHYG